MEIRLDLGAPPCVGCCWRPVCAAELKGTEKEEDAAERKLRC